jgi:membrane-bound lytic murein transglycosylase F
MMKKHGYLLFIFILIGCCVGCSHEPKGRKAAASQSVSHDWSDIVAKGKLTLLTENTSTSYFLYRGQPIGYDYELVKAFCNSHDLELETKVIGDMNQMFQMLDDGEGDLIACNLAITGERLNAVKFTEPLVQTRQVLVQRKPDNWRKMSKSSIDKAMIGAVLEMEGITIHVHNYSSFNARLLNLKEELGIDFEIIDAPGEIDSEELIRMVALGEFDYTIADENVALLNQTYYPNLYISTSISQPQNIAWAVRTTSDSLLLQLDEWIKASSNKKRLAYTYEKYFLSPKNHKERVQSEYSSLAGKRISPYDEAIKKHAAIPNWDWKLLAAMVYQESRFNPNAKSWAGAFGLMQLMPSTGERFGIDTSMVGEPNIEAGCKFLRYLEKLWLDKVPDALERQKFVLASYNVGQGHVLDAIALAEKMGLKTTVWDNNVEMALRLKSKPKYYTMDVVKHGYCRGNDVSNYVKDILTQYQHYLSLES